MQNSQVMYTLPCTANQRAIIIVDKLNVLRMILAETHWLQYRAMHVVLARYCYRKSSVRLSVGLVCDVDVPWAHKLDS